MTYEPITSRERAAMAKAMMSKEPTPTAQMFRAHAFSMAESLIEGLPYSEAVESKTREKLRSMLPQLLLEYAE